MKFKIKATTSIQFFLLLNQNFVPSFITNKLEKYEFEFYLAELNKTVVNYSIIFIQYKF